MKIDGYVAGVFHVKTQREFDFIYDLLAEVPFTKVRSGGEIGVNYTLAATIELSAFDNIKEKIRDWVVKKCSYCGIKKPISNFYPIKKTGEVCPRCKECERHRVRKTTGLNKQSKEYMAYHSKRYNERYPEKVMAQNKSRAMKPEIKGNVLHHWNYNEGFEKDVIELSLKDHGLIHRIIIYDKDTLTYRRRDTLDVLDTKEKHINYFLQFKKEQDGD